MEILVAGAKEAGIPLTAEQVALFERYLDVLLEWNKRMNLTAVRDRELIQQRHFVDSLACSLATGDLNGQKLIDVGSGAGFPGLPLKILYPSLRLCLVESIAKKASFLEAIVSDLELADVRVLCSRAEDLGNSKEHRQGYDWAVARAVARLDVLVEYLLPFVRIGGHALMQKGHRAGLEMDDAARGIAILGGGEAQLIPVQTAQREEPSYLVLIDKIKLTPEEYPRRAGVPAKRPL